MGLTADIKRSIWNEHRTSEFSSVDFTHLAHVTQVSRVIARLEEKEQIVCVGERPARGKPRRMFRLAEGVSFEPRPKRSVTARQVRRASAVETPKNDVSLPLWLAMGMPRGIRI